MGITGEKVHCRGIVPVNIGTPSYLLNLPVSGVNSFRVDIGTGQFWVLTTLTTHNSYKL